MMKKGALELSINSIVVIIISIVIISSGFYLFNRLKSNAVTYVESIDSQTENRLKSIMISESLDIIAYPNDLTLKRGESGLVTIGITNIFNETRCFKIGTKDIDFASVWRYENINSDGSEVTIVWKGNKNIEGLPYYVLIKPKEQVYRNILITPPREDKSYIYLINVPVLATKNPTTLCSSSQFSTITLGTPTFILYNSVNIYVNVP